MLHLLYFRYSQLSHIVKLPNTCILFPGPEAIDLETFRRKFVDKTDTNQPVALNIIILDGTWTQARTIYKENAFLHVLQMVRNNIYNFFIFFPIFLYHFAHYLLVNMSLSREYLHEFRLDT